MLFGVSLVHNDQALKAHDKGYELERQAASYCKKSRFFIVNMWKFFAKNTVLEKQTLMETRSRNDWANTVHMKIKSTKPKKDRSFLCCHALIWNIVIVNTITVCVFPEVYRKKLVFFFLLFCVSLCFLVLDITAEEAMNYEKYLCYCISGQAEIKYFQNLSWKKRHGVMSFF